MPYWRLYYHLIWATKNREPIIVPPLDAALHQYLRGKGVSLGAIVYAVGGVEDHVHVVASIPPSIAVGTFVGQLKGASSHWVTHVYRWRDGFEWQDGYGAISVSQRGLHGVVDYVLHQREHHAAQKTYPAMERIEIEDHGP